jgi:hypothetical protein
MAETASACWARLISSPGSARRTPRPERAHGGQLIMATEIGLDGDDEMIEQLRRAGSAVESIW